MSASLSPATPRRSAEVIVIGNRRAGQVNIEIVDQDTLDAEIEAAENPQEEVQDNKFDRNLAENMDPMALQALAAQLLDGIEADLQSRGEWEETANKASKYLGVKLVDPDISVSTDGTITKAVATCMLKANIKLWATARMELLPVGGPIKVRREDVTQAPETAPGAGIAPDAAPGMGHNSGAVDPDLTRDQMADALAMDMNHYLTVTDREYYPDFSKMLRSRALIGNAFRKVYRCPLKRRPVSVWVKAQDLIVSNDCSHLSGAGRRTERIRYRQATMRRLQAAGHYLDVPLSAPTGKTTNTEVAVAEIEGIAPSPQLPEDFEHLVYECYCEIGSGTNSSLIGDLGKLDRDETGKKPGYPLPYRVSIDEESRTILEIRRDWKGGDEDHRARTRYVKYGFIPGDGFYDWGLIHLVGNPTQVATMLQRAATDLTILKNFPAWIALKGPGSRQTNTVIRSQPGEVHQMDAAGAQKIQDVMMPVPYPDMTPETLALIQKMEADVAAIAGELTIPVSESLGNVPVGTIMSYMESVAQVPGAVHKDDHISQQQEFELLRELFAEDPASLIRGNRTPARMWKTAEELMDPDLVPAADPNTPSQMHRLAKAQANVTITGLPQFATKVDQSKVLHHAIEVVNGGDGTMFDAPPQQPGPPPSPPPQIVAAQIRAQAQAQSDQSKQQTEVIKAQGKLAETAADAQQREADRESDEIKAAMGVDKAHIEATHSTVNAALDRSQADAHHATDAAQKQQDSAAKFSAPFAPGGNGGGDETP